MTTVTHPSFNIPPYPSPHHHHQEAHGKQTAIFYSCHHAYMSVLCKPPYTSLLYIVKLHRYLGLGFILFCSVLFCSVLFCSVFFLAYISIIQNQVIWKILNNDILLGFILFCSVVFLFYYFYFFFLIFFAY